MKYFKGAIWTWFFLNLLFAQQVSGENLNESDQTLSPYFFVKSDDPNVDVLPLKSTSADVQITGVIASVKVKQIYENKGSKPLEAIYVFPGSTRAAVYGMTMTIGDRKIVASVRARDVARKQYEAAKKEGKSASLLEQNRPNVFQMNVANILPGDQVLVELHYVELLVPTESIYEFVYPTVVGPRYSNQKKSIAPSSEQWVEHPYTKEKELPSYSFDISVKLSAGMPLQQVQCDTYKVNISYQNQTEALIQLDDSEKKQGNRDYILKYVLSAGEIESGLLLSKKDDENFFLLMVQPPRRVVSTQIVPREYIFIIDVSGSMCGFPLTVSKKLFRDLIGGLQPNDVFNIILFAGTSDKLAEKSVPANAENLKSALRWIDSQHGGGGTELLPALNRALSIPKQQGYSRNFVLLTDGYVDVETESFDLIRKHLGDVNLFAFGIGTSVNRFLIEGLARIGMGEPFVVTQQQEAEAAAGRFREYISSPLLTDIALRVEDFNVFDVTPDVYPDLFAERPLLIFGKWKNLPKGTITLTGKSAGG
ncbi:VIT and VWA domain-containing protein, partial [bacterium]|nr:VIT and VWA domain-containing protein [bacterium]